MTEEKFEEKFEAIMRALADFAVQVEDATAKLRQVVAEIIGVEEPSKVADASPENAWDPERIKWAEAVSAAGRPYQRHPAEGGKIESTADYHGLLNFLKAHGGKAEFNGYFYWLFKDGSTIGRRRSKNERGS